MASPVPMSPLKESRIMAAASQTLPSYATWLSLGVFAAVVALLGGSSRPDPVQIVALRPLAALAVFPALLWLTFEQVRAHGFLVGLFAFTVAWMALQLVPLPVSIWSSLPGRADIAAIDAIVGLEEHWRPISMVPTRGWNALAAMIVPAAALLLAIASRANRTVLLQIIVALGGANALMGLLQAVVGGSGILSFYGQLRPEAPSGFFANENHSAVLCAITLMLSAKLVSADTNRAQRRPFLIGYVAAFFLAFVAILAGGSRAGLLCAAVALAASGYFVWERAQALRRQTDRQRTARRLLDNPRFVTAMLAGGLLLALVALYYLARTPAFTELSNSGSIEELRWKVLPVLIDMARNFWLLGTGIGSFEEVYHIYEGTELLGPKYLNHAHNDWLQLVIEGGLPAALALGAFLAWWLWCALRLARRKSAGRGEALFWIGLMAVVALASIVDYPLRTPLFQVIAMWFVLALAATVRETDRGFIGDGPARSVKYGPRTERGPGQGERIYA